jgi:ribosomal protein S18 acetylase RimI-like enzyme
VARLAEVVVGYVLVKFRNYDMPGHVKRRVMVIDEICVEESCRNQGIGKEMMEDVRALARAFGCTDLQLGVYPQNDAGVAFYQKCGFTIRSIDMQRKV